MAAGSGPGVTTPAPFTLLGFGLVEGAVLNSNLANPHLSTENAITAATTQTLAGAYVLRARVSRISVCANAGDAVALPSMLPGSWRVVANDGAQNATVFAAASQTIDGVAGATGVTLSAARRSLFYCVAPGVIFSAGMAKSS